jgi:formylglycine-generating enzyme required for sulfatase activity/energy-coupling factor transporter ATP-binding protein EcfA2
VTGELDARVLRLKTELDDHSRIARYLGLDFERPIQSLNDGYPENAVAWVGKITERLLKQLWRHHNVPGTPAGKTLKDLIGGCRPYIRSHQVLDALHDIQRLRNRSSHDGYVIAEEDGLTAVRRLLDVLAWYTSTGSGALSGQAPRLAPAVAAKAEFLAGLYVTLDYKPAKRFELSRHTVYQLFVRERGLRSEYVELLLSRDPGDLAKVLEVTGGELLATRLPKLTRFLILEGDSTGDVPAALLEDRRVVTYDHFMGTMVDLDQHLADVAGLYPRPDSAVLPVAGDLLTGDERSGQMQITEAGGAAALLQQVAASGGNLLIVGRPGSGKTTLLKQLVTAAPAAGARRYRFFFDLSLKGHKEPFADFVTRTLAPYFSVEAAYVFPAFCYFARAGSVMCALDGFDEAVPEITQAGFLELFTELTEVLSAESAVVMTSRVSFLEDSPEVRRLLDGTSLMSERLVQELHAQGVDPLRVPRFSVLRLRDEPSGGSLLAARLESELGGDSGASAAAGGGDELGELLWRHITQVAGPELLPRVAEFFGLALLRGVTTFTLAELVNGLGISVFDGGQIGSGGFRLRALFRPAGRASGVADAGEAGAVVAFRHAAYQELLAAEFLRTPGGRDAALAAAARPRLTEQVRDFLHRRSGAAAGSSDCILPAGAYLVGPSHHLMLRRVQRPVQLDQFAVTVGRYKQFLVAVARDGSALWDHPATPGGQAHQPWRDRLRIPDYYDDPAYDNHPAIAVSWWSAYAFARFDGKRLPTSLEWEAAARGSDGRLFPWGDQVDMAAVNCADTWSDHPLITYEAWRAELDRGRLKDALPGPVDAHPANVSPFGVREMAGNVWELTATVLEDLNEAVICGGSFDNPYRAVQACSKGTYRRRGASNAVGFRCARDLP